MLRRKPVLGVDSHSGYLAAHRALTRVQKASEYCRDRDRTINARFDVQSAMIASLNQRMAKMESSYILAPEEPQKPAQRRVDTFMYDGVWRQGYVVGLRPGVGNRPLLTVQETWNERDGAHDVLKVKHFRTEFITYANVYA